jgi:hypothetical protein
VALLEHFRVVQRSVLHTAIGVVRQAGRRLSLDQRHAQRDLLRDPMKPLEMRLARAVRIGVHQNQSARGNRRLKG